MSELINPSFSYLDSRFEFRVYFIGSYGVVFWVSAEKLFELIGYCSYIEIFSDIDSLLSASLYTKFIIDSYAIYIFPKFPKLNN